MPETLDKLRPDRDLQCYFFNPSAIAAISGASATGFTVSGTWRQQFDWAVIEWNRDNVFEHPAFRYLPDGDLSGLTLTWEETRTNCIPVDSDLFPTVDWPYLRVWTDDDPGAPYFVALIDYATAIEGSYQAAYADFTLSGTPVAGDFVGIAYIEEHFTYEFQGGDILENAVEAIKAAIEAFSPLLKATRTGTTVRVYYTAGDPIASATTGANGNRFSMYTYSTGSAVWDADQKTFANGTSPTKWQFTIDFSTVQGATRDAQGVLGTPAPFDTDKVRKMRWTYSADLQAGEFVRSEFNVAITNWGVTGTGRGYQVAGPGSRRLEENDVAMVYNTAWNVERGNYSGGMIQYTSDVGDWVGVEYTAGQAHTLYVGTRYLDNGPVISFEVDSSPAGSADLAVPEEDVLIRWPVGQYGAGTHTLKVTHAGSAGEPLYFDFVEIAVPSSDLPVFPSLPGMTLATDWDTLHSVAIAPERTAWFIDSLGFHGRQNHYVGALLWFELWNPDNQYATGTVTFGGTADVNALVSVSIGRSDKPDPPTVIERVIHAGDTPETIARSFAGEFNRGYTGIWASSSGGALTVQSRSIGIDGNFITLDADTDATNLTISVSTNALDGGVDGIWRPDLTASPRLNRAARDWTVAFFQALDAAGIDAVSAFSTELKDVDPSVSAGIVQRSPTGDPILLPTPAYQTNFSPTSIAFWKEVYKDCADLMAAAGLQPYLQFGEVQWWYFPNDGRLVNPLEFGGMPYYDAWAQAEFQTQYGHAMAVFLDNNYDPLLYPDEVEFLADTLGNYTDTIMAYVVASHATARFEVLYPVDVNQTDFNQAVNFPTASWTASALDTLKTEALGFTFTRQLNKCEEAIDLGGLLGFDPAQRSHLIGIGDSTAPWLKEARIAEGKRFEGVVFFALDQFCLIGYGLPFPATQRRSVRYRG